MFAIIRKTDRDARTSVLRLIKATAISWKMSVCFPLIDVSGFMKIYDQTDALPAEYKVALIELLTFQADSEFAGGQRVAENMRLAPRPEEAFRLAKKHMEEIGHAWYCWNILEPLGVDVNVRVQHLVQNPANPDPQKVRIINGFRRENWTPLFTDWADVAMFSTVVTPAAVAFLGQYRQSSYLPWRQASERIWQEEKGHLAFGVWAAKRVIEFEGEKGREKLQESVPKFMKMGLGFPGRPSEESENFGKYFEMGLKVRTALQVQEEYMDIVSKRLNELGLQVPEGIEPDYDMRIGYSLGPVSIY
jgi:ring-1,2-phenylacetyl-CoA epoxidase subunit PaaA